MNLLVLATWMGFQFVAPADTVPLVGVVPATSYRMMQRSETGSDMEKILYAAPNFAAPRPTPRAPGLLDTVWISALDDARPYMFRLYSSDSSGNESNPSNPVVALVPALADTGYIDLTDTADRFTGKIYVQSRPAPLNQGKYYAAWSRAPGDSLFTSKQHWRTSLLTNSPVLSLRRFQTLDMQAACVNGKLIGFPFWALSGEWVPCP